MYKKHTQKIQEYINVENGMLDNSAYMHMSVKTNNEYFCWQAKFFAGKRY